MARKKIIKKRTRVIGEFEAQTTALLDGLWAEFAEAETQHELGRVKRTIWASEAEYAAIRVYLAQVREAGGAAPAAGVAGQRLEAILQAELVAVRLVQGGGLGPASGAAGGAARAVAGAGGGPARLTPGAESVKLSTGWGGTAAARPSPARLTRVIASDNSVLCQQSKRRKAAVVHGSGFSVFWSPLGKEPEEDEG